MKFKTKIKLENKNTSEETIDVVEPTAIIKATARKKKKGNRPELEHNDFGTQHLERAETQITPESQNKTDVPSPERLENIGNQKTGLIKRDLSNKKKKGNRPELKHNDVRGTKNLEKAEGQIIPESQNKTDVPSPQNLDNIGNQKPVVIKRDLSIKKKIGNRPELKQTNVQDTKNIERAEGQITPETQKKPEIPNPQSQDNIGNQKTGLIKRDVLNKKKIGNRPELKQTNVQDTINIERAEGQITPETQKKPEIPNPQSQDNIGNQKTGLIKRDVLNKKKIGNRPELKQTNVQDTINIERAESQIKPESQNKTEVPTPQSQDNIGNQANIQVTTKKKNKSKKSKKGKSQIERQLNPKKFFNSAEKQDKFLREFIFKVEEYFYKELFLPAGSNILVAVSGGVDSITLLDTMAQISANYNLKLAIAHFNHKLRGKSSDEDLDFVRKVAEDYNVYFTSSSENVRNYAAQNSLSIEHAARIMRYRFFERTANSLKSNYIVTAHTADDSVETVLLNLIRGSGLTGLSGIPQIRTLSKNLSVIRPLLQMKKRDIIEYAQRRKLVWREDETNSLLLFTRNKIRHGLLPMLEKNYSPAIIDVITRTAKLLRGADKYITERVKFLMSTFIKDKREGRFSIRASSFKSHDEFMQGELIQTALRTIFKLQPLPMQAIDRILSIFDSPTGTIIEISKNYFALKDRDYVIFSKKQVSGKMNEIIDGLGTFQFDSVEVSLSIVNKKEVKFNTDPLVEYFEVQNFPKLLYLRNWEPGDFFQPLGLEGTVKVSDFLTNEKVSLIDKQNVLVLATKNDIVWVCGKRISDKFKVTKSTKDAIRAEFKDNL